MRSALQPRHVHRPCLVRRAGSPIIFHLSPAARFSASQLTLLRSGSIQQGLVRKNNRESGTLIERVSRMKAQQQSPADLQALRAEKKEEEDIEKLKRDIQTYVEDECGIPAGVPLRVVPDGSSYLGGWVNSVPHGFGRLIATDVSYKGEWVEGEWQGKGAMYGDGVWYRGEFRNGVPHGHGVMATSEGDRYEGMFRDGMHHGRGRFRVADGGEYVGEWRDGHEDGRGIYTAGANEYDGLWAAGALLHGVWKRQGKVYYEGEFRSEEHAFLPHGKGKLFSLLRTGAVTYTGELADAKRHGRGIDHADDGVYTGGFKDDARSGHGTLKGAEKDIYRGEWDAGLRSGRGSVVFANGNGHYEGGWKFDRPEGDGVRVWPLGDTYKGSFFCGFMHGAGSMQWCGGATYTGEWRANKLEGSGEVIFVNGWRLRGRFKDGLLQEGTIHHPDGRAVRGKVGEGWLPVV